MIHDQNLNYGMCIAACRMFQDSVLVSNDVLMHRAKASFDKCLVPLRQLGPTKRLRRVVEGLRSSMIAVYVKYDYGFATAASAPKLLSDEESTSDEFKKFCRDLERAENQRPRC
jgi:hypothetical protein